MFFVGFMSSLRPMCHGSTLVGPHLLAPSSVASCTILANHWNSLTAINKAINNHGFIIWVLHYNTRSYSNGRSMVAEQGENGNEAKPHVVGEGPDS